MRSAVTGKMMAISSATDRSNSLVSVMINGTTKWPVIKIER